MPKPVDATTAYVPGLDGLRTVAVVAVLLYHLDVPWAGGGLLGVGVFFTLSGYLITLNLVRSARERGTLGLRTFWVRRFRRLVPAVLVLLAGVLGMAAVLEPHELGDRAREALSAALYVNNWFVIAGGESYFDAFVVGPLDHMWSLSVEEQFYLLWPLLLALLIAVAGLRRRRLAAAALAAAAASFGLMAWLHAAGADATRIYEGTDTRAGGLLVGAALAVALARPRGVSVVPRAVAEALGLAGVAGILALVALTGGRTGFLFSGGLVLLSAATAAAIVAVLQPASTWSRLLGAAPLRWLGERSYGIYLWHMPLAAYLEVPLHDLPAWARFLVVGGGATACAAASWRLVEDPIRRHGVLGPLRRWRARAAAAGPAGPVAPARLPVPVRAAGAGALLAAVAVAAVAVPVRAGGFQRGPQAVGMAAVREAAPGDAAAAGEGRTGCRTVVHVGDSTSIGMFSDAQLPDPAFRADVTYGAAGAERVIDDVYGARSTIEGWRDYPSAEESVRRILADGVPDDACWVMAVGVNDAANIAAGMAAQAPERVDRIMALLGGRRVLWPTAVTDKDSGYWARPNMAVFNDELRAAQGRYPNLVLFDWAAEAESGWFAEGDWVHYDQWGNAERSRRFAAALAVAFPEGADPADDEPGRVVASGVRESAEEAFDALLAERAADGADGAEGAAEVDADGDGYPDSWGNATTPPAPPPGRRG